MSTPRRSFLGRLTALVALGATPGRLAAAIEPPPAAPDERWLLALAQREQRMIIETGVISDALALRRGLNFLDVSNTDYTLRDDRLGLAIGVHSAALAFVLSDAMWAKHALGARWDVRDARGQAATTNPFRAGAPHTIEALHARGVHLLACNRSLMRLGRDLAGPSGDAAAVHRDLVANVLPQVTVVPAMVVALSRAQARGVPYMAV